MPDVSDNMSELAMTSEHAQIMMVTKFLYQFLLLI